MEALPQGEKRGNPLFFLKQKDRKSSFSKQKQKEKFSSSSMGARATI